MYRYLSVTGWSPDLKYLGYIQAHNTSGYGHMCFNRDAVVRIGGKYHSHLVNKRTLIVLLLLLLLMMK